MANEFYNVMPTKQYASTLDILSQEFAQIASCAWDKGTLVGEESYFNQLDPFEMTFDRSRYDDTTFTEPTYQRRRITKTPANVAIPLDKIDTVETLVDPKSELSQNGAYAAGRAKDKLTWQALYGDAFTGKAGGTTVSFDANNIVDKDVGAAGSGLNLEKILAAVEGIMTGSVDLMNPMNELTMVIAPQQWNDYLQIAKLTSTDYVANKPLENGIIGRVPGVPNSKVIVSNMLPYINTAGTSANVDISGGSNAWATGGIAVDVDTTAERAVTLFCKSGVGFGTWEETQVRAEERPDKNYIWQLWMQLQCGVARLEEKKVWAIEAVQS